jgi:GT2 family glycosyltransferase
MAKRPDGGSGPLFSVVIPTYRRPEPLASCLRALASLEFSPEDFEVIVVDDGSSTALEPVLVPFGTQLNMTLLKQAHAGPSAARNAGARVAGGRLLCFTDDDCLPAHDWLLNLQARFERQPRAAIGGSTLNALPGNIYSRTSQIIRDAVYAYYNLAQGRRPFFASNNLAVPAEQFQEVGGFHTEFASAEDREFCDRWLQSGYDLVYAPEAVVHHAHELTFRSFWRQHCGYGRGALQFQRLRVEADTRPIQHDLRFYGHLLRYPVTHHCGLDAARVSMLLVLARVAYATGYVAGRLQP